MVKRTWNPAERHPRANNGLARSLSAGVAATVLAAALWAVIAGLTGSTFALAAVALGFGVGRVMAATAGTSRRLPSLAAVLTLLGCLAGYLFIETRATAEAVGLGTVDLLHLMLTRPELVRDVFTVNFGLIEGAFWLVAAALAYRLTARAVKRMNILADIAPARPVARPSGLNFDDHTQPPPPPLPKVGQHPSKFFTRVPAQPTGRAMIPSQYSRAREPAPVGVGKRPARRPDARSPRAF